MSIVTSDEPKKIEDSKISAKKVKAKANMMFKQKLILFLFYFFGLDFAIFNPD